MKDMGALMKQAQGMQAKLAEAQARMAEVSAEGQSGGGLVRVTLKGAGALAGVAIDDSLMVPGEAEMLSDLLVAAHADAKSKLDAAQQALMKEALGPMAGMMGATPGLPGF